MCGNLTAVEYRHVVPEPKGILQIVRGQQDRPRGGRAGAQNRLQRTKRALVESVVWLVKQQQWWVVYDGSSQR